MTTIVTWRYRFGKYSCIWDTNIHFAVYSTHKYAVWSLRPIVRSRDNKTCTVTVPKGTLGKPFAVIALLLYFSCVMFWCGTLISVNSRPIRQKSVQNFSESPTLWPRYLCIRWQWRNFFIIIYIMHASCFPAMMWGKLSEMFVTVRSFS